MAYSKTFLLLGLVFAVVLLVSSEVSARELVQTQGKTDAVEETNKHHDHRHGHGHGHGHRHGHGHHGAAGEKEAETETNQN